MKKITKDKGYTLIEYLVAILIGLILLAGIASFFVGMSSSTRAQSAVSEVQEKGRFALYFLTNDIQLAGWSDPSVSNVVGAAVDNYIDIANTSDGTGAKSTDQIAIKYEADVDCLGNTVASGITTNIFLVESGSLKCSSQNKSEPLINGVESLHFTYGVDSNNDGVPDQYLNATALKADSKLAEDVTTVKVSMVIVSDGDVSKSNRTQSFTLDTAGTYTSDSDKKLRKVFTTTIFVPNRPRVVGS